MAGRTRSSSCFSGSCNSNPSAIACAKPFGIGVVAYGTKNVLVLALAEQRLATLQEISVDADTVSGVAWSSGGKLAACGGRNMFIFEPLQGSSRTAHPFCPYTWKLCAVLRAPGTLLSVAWSVGTTEMLILGGTNVSLWHSAPPAPPERDILAEEESEEQVEYAKSMKKWERRFDAAFTIDDSFCAWSAETTEAVVQVGASGDGRSFATRSDMDTAIKAWFARTKDDSTNYEYQELSHPQPVTDFTWSTSGHRPNALLVTCADGLLRIWVEARSGAEVSFYAAATFPDTPLPQPVSAAAWVSPETAVSEGNIEVLETPLGIMPEILPEMLHVACIGPDGAGKVWSVDGLGSKTTQMSLTVSEVQSSKVFPSSSSSLGPLLSLHALHVDVEEKSEPLQAGQLAVAVLVGRAADGQLHLWEYVPADADAILKSMRPPRCIVESYDRSGDHTQAIQTIELSSDCRFACGVRDQEIVFWKVASHMLSFANREIGPLGWCTDVSGGGLTAALCWLPDQPVLLVARAKGVTLHAVRSDSNITTMDSSENSLCGATVVTVAAFRGDDPHQFIIVGTGPAGTVPPGFPSPMQLVVWKLILAKPADAESGFTTYAAEILLKTELPEGCGHHMAAATSSRFEWTVHGALLDAVKTDDMDATNCPPVFFVGDGSCNVAVNVLAQGAEKVVESEDDILAKAVAHFPEPKRTTMLTALKRMPAGAREAAIAKMMATAPPAASSANAADDNGAESDTFRIDKICELAKPVGQHITVEPTSIERIAAYDAERIAVQYNAPDGSVVVVWRATPGSWPEFEISKVLTFEGEKCIDVVWNACEIGMVQLAVVLPDRVEVYVLNLKLTKSSGGEDWKFTGVIPESQQPITSVTWLPGCTLAVGSAHHLSTFSEVGILETQSLVEPDYHPDKLEALLMSGDDAREMLGRIAQNALVSAPEEWESQRWRPPATSMEALFGIETKKNSDEETIQSNLYSSFALDDSPDDSDPMNFMAAKALAAKIKGGAQLLGLSPDQRVHLSAILDVHAQETIGSLDQRALRFAMATTFFSKIVALTEELRFAKPEKFSRKISSANHIWAFHSETQEALVQSALPSDATLTQMIDCGIPLWMKSKIDLENVCMKIAMSTFKKTKNPDDVMLLYVILKKTNMIVALYKSIKNDKVAAFLSNDFTQQRWWMAARKNGYNVLKKQKYQLAAAFMILGGDIPTALTVLAKNAGSFQLALMAARLTEGDYSDSYKNLLHEFVLTPALERGDRFTASIVYWIQEEYITALEVLCPGIEDDKAATTNADFSAAVAWDVMQYISNRPVLRRAGLKPVHYSGMVRVGIHAALEYAEKGQSLLALQLLSTLSAWDRFTSISNAEINIHFVVELMHELAVVSCAQIPIDAMARSTSTAHSDSFTEINVPVLPSIQLLGRRFGLCEATILSAISHLRTAELQFGLDREIIFDSSGIDFVANTPSLVGDRAWDVVESLIEVGTIPSTGALSFDFSQRIDSLYRAVRDVCQAPAGRCVPDGTVGSAVLIGKFAAGWHSQDFRTLLSMFYPGQQEDAWNLADKRIASVSIGHMLLLLLAKLAFVVEQRLSAVDADVRSACVREKILRRLWAWFSYVKSVLCASLRSGEEAAVFPTAPTAAQQQRAASNLWKLLIHDEAASHDVSRLPGLAPVLNQIMSPPGSIAGMAPVDLHSAPKEVPFRDFAINALKPTVVAIAASKNVQEINIRGPLRRSMGTVQSSASPTPSSSVTRNRKCAAIEAHPTKSFYATGTYDGGCIEMWQYGSPSEAFPLSKAAVSNSDQRITKIHFNVNGTRLGATDAGGHLTLFNVDQHTLSPLMGLQCHTRAAMDFAWLNAGSVVATVGNSQNKQNLCIWDTLLPQGKMLIHAETCHESGGSSVIFSPKHFRLFTGGDKGDIGIFDLRMLKMQRLIDGHSSAIQAITISHDKSFLYSGCRDGTMKVWDIQKALENGGVDEDHSTLLVAESKDAHVRNTGALGIFSSHSNTSLGITSIYSSDMNSQCISCGADGRVVLWKPIAGL